jgi:helix-turn-helix protein
MRFEGKLTRDGRWWLAEVPLFDAITQGRTRKEALAMIADWFESIIDRDGFTAEVHSTGNRFEIGGSDTAAMIALLLRRRRQAIGASLSEIASRLGIASRNAYARYERGDAVPTVEKLDELLKATEPGGELVLRASSVTSTPG